MAYTDKDKKKLLEALKSTMGIISPACEQVGIDRGTYYNWYNEDEDFKVKVDQISEMQKDAGEYALIKKLREGDTNAIKFYLSRKARDRGYGDRVDNFNVNMNLGHKDLEKLTDEELDAEIKRLERAIDTKET